MKKLTPLKWAGGKRWLVDLIKSRYLASGCNSLAEPFFGGGSVTLGLIPEKSFVSDINFPLVCFWKEIKKGFQIDENIKMINEESTFYKNRDLFNEEILSSNPDESKIAALFYYLNRTGFNGLCRFNNSGKFNVPFGKYKKINYTQDFTDYKDDFENIEISCSSYQAANIPSDSFVYLDPPYDTIFSKYSKEAFGWKEQENLVDWLVNLKNKHVLISNQATERIVELYTKNNLDYILLDAPRRISSDGDRSSAKEILAWKK